MGDRRGSTVGSTRGRRCREGARTRVSQKGAVVDGDASWSGGTTAATVEGGRSTAQQQERSLGDTATRPWMVGHGLGGGREAERTADGGFPDAGDDDGGGAEGGGLGAREMGVRWWRRCRPSMGGGCHGRSEAGEEGSGGGPGGGSDGRPWRRPERVEENRNLESGLWEASDGGFGGGSDGAWRRAEVVGETGSGSPADLRWVWEEVERIGYGDLREF